MKKEILPARPLILPLPALLVSCESEKGRSIISLAWGGIVSSKPPRVTLGITPQRFSYTLIRESREFAINLPNASLAHAVQYCGTYSGRDVDKFQSLGLTPVQGQHIQSPMIGEAPINLECKLEDVIELSGSHHLFLGEILQIHAVSEVVSSEGTINPEQAGIISFGGGKYWGAGPPLVTRS